MAELSQILSAFGLSASAGLNAYIPLLLIAVGARLFPDLIRLSEPYDLLAANWSIAALVVLLAVEVFADKVPVVDHLNDVVGLFIRPAAGAVLFAAYAGGPVGFLAERLAPILGLLVAGAPHGATSTPGPMVPASTGGLGNPLVSTVEDIAAFLTSLVAVVAPFLIGVAIVLFVALFAWWLHKRRITRLANVAS